MIVASRVTARRVELGITQSELARRVGVSQTAIAKVENGGRGSAHLHKIARELQTTAAYLEGETEDVSAGLPALPVQATIAMLGLVMVRDLQASFGLGASVIDEADDYHRDIAFPRIWARGASDLKKLFLIQGEGDSMEPTITDGDDILVDGGKTVIDAQDRIWALRYGELGMVKRVRRKPAGGFELNSDNAAVSPIEALRKEFDVLGRVIWVGRRV